MSDADKVNAVLRTLRDGADGPEVSTESLISEGVVMLLAEVPGYLDRRVAEAVARQMEGGK
jgi:hypothetical protein